MSQRSESIHSESTLSVDERSQAPEPLTYRDLLYLHEHLHELESRLSSQERTLNRLEALLNRLQLTARRTETSTNMATSQPTAEQTQSSMSFMNGAMRSSHPLAEPLRPRRLQGNIRPPISAIRGQPPSSRQGRLSPNSVLEHPTFGNENLPSN